MPRFYRLGQFIVACCVITIAAEIYLAVQAISEGHVLMAVWFFVLAAFVGVVTYRLCRELHALRKYLQHQHHRDSMADLAEHHRRYEP